MLVASRLYALSASVAFLASLGYFVYAYAQFGTVTGRWHSGAWTAVWENVLLFSLFAGHHSLLARTGAKTWIRQHVPASLERATYVLVASVLFTFALWNWQPVPGVAWRLNGPMVVVAEVFCLSGVILTGIAVSSLDLLEFVGLRQPLGLAPTHKSDLVATGPYGLVRHPIYLGWILLVWSMPVMTGTRLTFAVISTAYLVLAIPFEERSLHESLGKAYADYAHKVRWRVVPGVF